jgi:hypothetical protein
MLSFLLLHSCTHTDTYTHTHTTNNVSIAILPLPLTHTYTHTHTHQQCINGPLLLLHQVQQIRLPRQDIFMYLCLSLCVCLCLLHLCEVGLHHLQALTEEVKASKSIKGVGVVFQCLGVCCLCLCVGGWRCVCCFVLVSCWW